MAADALPGPAALAALKAPPRARLVAALVAVLVVGYLCMSRSFAHLGAPPLYIGEVSLLLVVVLAPQALPGLWLGSLARRTPLSGVAWAMYLLLAYGAVQTLRGVAAGYSAKVALQTFAFNVYPAYFFVGAWAAAQARTLLPRLMPPLAWIHGVYGVLYIVVLAPLFVTPMGAGETDRVDLFGQPYGASIVLLGLLCFEARLGRFLVPVLLQVFILMGIQMRAEWLSLSVAVLAWAALKGHLLRVFQLAAVVLVFLVVALLTDLSLPAPPNRGEVRISARYIVARAIAPVDERAAAALVPDAAAESFASTVSWRTAWWRQLWDMTHSRGGWTLFGRGYGYPIWHHHPEEGRDEVNRTPHSVVIFALSYTGWVGLGLFYLLQAALAAALWRVYRTTGQAFGLCFLMLSNVWAVFDPFYETPFHAVPVYLVLGMAAAPLLGPAGGAGRRPAVQE